MLDYAGNSYDLYQPEVGEPKPSQDSEIITIPCPACGFNNNFWGKLDSNGFLIEHYGRKCQGFFEDKTSQEREHCDYRFRAKYCNECGADNDISARVCHQCDATLVDPDKKLKEALRLKDALVFECLAMDLALHKNEKGKNCLKVSYVGDNQAQVHEFWSLSTPKQKQDFKDFLSDLTLPTSIDLLKSPLRLKLSTTSIASDHHSLSLPESQGDFGKYAIRYLLMN